MGKKIKNTHPQLKLIGSYKNKECRCENAANLLMRGRPAIPNL